MTQDKDDWKDADCDCIKCKKHTVLYREHEDDEGHEDYQYRCQNPECNHSWWVDGIDY